MGYYTQVDIYLHPVVEGTDCKPAAEELKTLLEREEFYIADWDEGFFHLEDARWYDYEEEIARFSENYPNVMFEISGDGDGSDDIWQLYCYRGHIQDGLVKTYIPFDKNYCMNDVNRRLLAALHALKEGGHHDNDPIVQLVIDAISKEILIRGCGNYEV